MKTISQEQYEQVLKSYPMIADLYVTIKEFYEIIYSKHEEKLDAWLVKLEKFNIPELQTYVNGIRQDIVAVKNGIYIYDMISGISRVDVKNVLLIMHTDSVIPGVFPHT